VLNHSGSILKRFEPGEPVELTVAEAGHCPFAAPIGEKYGKMMNYRISAFQILRQAHNIS